MGRSLSTNSRFYGSEFHTWKFVFLIPWSLAGVIPATAIVFFYKLQKRRVR
jgi:hypothetical protein